VSQYRFTVSSTTSTVNLDSSNILTTTHWFINELKNWSDNANLKSTKIIGKVILNNTHRMRGYPCTQKQ
jgi:hypothetical protein